MAFFGNLSIKSKILSVVFLIIALELAMSAGAIYFLDAVSNRLTRLMDVDARKMHLAALVKTNLFEIHRAQKNIILHPSQEEIERQSDQKTLHLSRLRLNLADLDRLTNQQERYAFIELNSRLDDFMKVFREIEALIPKIDVFPNGQRSDAYAAAIALSFGSARDAYNRLSEQIDGILQRMDESMARHRVESEDYFKLALTSVLILCCLGIGVGWGAGLLVARKISAGLDAVVTVTDAIARGKLDTPVTVTSADEIGRLAASVKQMQGSLIEASEAFASQNWIKTGIERVNEAMRGQVRVADLCRNVITEIATYTQAAVGALYVVKHRSEPMLAFGGGYACTRAERIPKGIDAGQGLIGQAVLTKAPITVQDVPAGYIKVCSALGDGCPACISVAPLLFEDHAVGAIELAFFKTPSALQRDFLQQVLPKVAITLQTVRGREELSEALARAQVLTEELQQQQDELKATNGELEEQTQRLKQSEEKLRQQQDQLEEANAELEEKNEYLENHKQIIERANRELERSQREIEEKAEQLAMSGRYKSEFLANMSHELRTPLNSILLLARMFCDNKEGRLTPEQVRSAHIIHSSGSDLLTLINEVLDLAKIESGRMDLRVERLDPRELARQITDQYTHLAADKGLPIDVQTRPDCPTQLRTDRKRLGQILRNLIHNAVKFTEKGGIHIVIGRPDPGDVLPAGMRAESTIAIAVTDSGIGIPTEKQHLVFEAFQQLDTGAARKFAGTGLGLSISRNLARLLGGDILLFSRIGVGSTFTLYLPDELRLPAPDPEARIDRPGLPRKIEPAATPPVLELQSVPDDRESLGKDDAVILVIEDDPLFAEHLIGLCRLKNLKVLHAPSGQMGLDLAAAYLPKGILLDIHLPEKDGWAVLEALKQNPNTRHIPVHIVSVEDPDIEAYARGAIGFLTKPVQAEDLERALAKLENVFERQIKELLVVEDDQNLRGSIVTLIGNTDVRTDQAATAAEAIAAIRSKRYDCMILDLGLPDMNGLDMLRLLEGQAQEVLPPVIVYTGRELTREQEAELQVHSESIIIKGVRSEERLYDEASLFLHRIVKKMPEKQRRMITNLYDADMMFRDKKVLLADDDMRSVFALSKLLEEKGIQVLKAENGRKALDLLDTHSDVDLILLDMMMPDMDGYETMQRLRSSEDMRNIPIIALTAKAMKKDRERCIQSGASDYLAKPVDLGRLLSMMRVWMYR